MKTGRREESAASLVCWDPAQEGHFPCCPKTYLEVSITEVQQRASYQGGPSPSLSLAILTFSPGFRARPLHFW